MSRLTQPLLLATLIGAAAHAAPVPARVEAEAQLRAINHRFADSHVVANGDYMDALTDDDFLLTARDGAWLDRRGFLAQMRQPPSPDGASYGDVEVRLSGDAAIVHGVFEAMQRGMVVKTRYTDVYAWNGTAWRLVSAQNTPVKDPANVQLHTATAPNVAPWQGQDPRGDDLAVLRTLNEQYVQAFRAADVAWYDAHLAPDYVVVFGDGSFHDRAAALADFAKPYFEDNIRSFPVDKVRIRRFGDLALIHAENAYELKDGRKGVNRYTDIWRKHGGRWTCIAAHITVHKPPG